MSIKMNRLQTVEALLASAKALEISASAKDAAILSKLAKAMKVTAATAKDVIDAISTVEEGWTIDTVVDALPVKRETVFPQMDREAFKKKYGLTMFSTPDSDAPGSWSWVWSYDTATGPPDKALVNASVKDVVDNIMSVAVVAKDPKPGLPEGTILIAAPPKAKVENNPNPYVDGNSTTYVSLKLAGIKKVKQAFNVNAPTGESAILPELDAPAFWTWLFKTKAFAEVKTKLNDPNATAGRDRDLKRAAQAKNASSHIQGTIGTCSVCTSTQKLRNGLLVLHGYQRPGWGEIHGRCHGVDFPPYELSAEGTTSYNAAIKPALARAEMEYDRVKSTGEVTLYLPALPDPTTEAQLTRKSELANVDKLSPSEVAELSEINRYLDDLNGVYKKPGYYASVVDISTGKVLSQAEKPFTKMELAQNNVTPEDTLLPYTLKRLAAAKHNGVVREKETAVAFLRDEVKRTAIMISQWELRPLPGRPA